MQLAEDTLRRVFACRGPICNYIIHVSLFMSCPLTYLSTHLSNTHPQSYHMTICFLWASESFDADCRGKCSLCSWDFCAKTEADNGMWTDILLYPPSFQWLVSDGLSCTCLTIWTALGMGKGWPD